jgi:8-oxoguanine deaminase
VDHHYIFTGGSLNWIDRLFDAADVMGMRMCAARGAMDVASDLYAEWQVMKIDDVLKDMDRLVTKYHDLSPGSFRTVATAPTSVLSVSPEFYREVGAFAEKRSIQLHTHCGETKEEITRAVEKRGRRPLEILDDAGWLKEGTWLAHAIHYSPEEVQMLGKRKVGISHCPHANMRLGSGTCRVREQHDAGVKVSVGVDGSASNDSGHFLGELRTALYVSRLSYGADSLTVEDVLEFGTMGGARVLRREQELGSLEPGKLADIAIFPAENLASLGAENPVLGLVLCRPRDVDALIIQGKIRVRDGQILGFDYASLADKHREIAKKIWE